jgi:hypothetical protein
MSEINERERILAGYVDEAAVAEEFDVSVQTVRRWRRQKIGPPFAKVGSGVLYPVDLGREWLRNRLTQPRAKAS